MANRNIDTGFYNSKFVRGLKPAYKALYNYLQLACDHAGIWEVDIDLAIYLTGQKEITEADAIEFLQPKILVLKGGERWFLLDYCLDQHKTNQLNPCNTYHWGTIVILQKNCLMTNDFIVLNEQIEAPIKPLYSNSKDAILKLKAKALLNSDLIITEELVSDIVESKRVPKIKKVSDLSKIEFSEFWDAYDKKKGEKDKIAKKWDALSLADQEAVFIHIAAYKVEQPNKWYRKDPETYLNNKSWNDEILTPPSPATGGKPTGKVVDMSSVAKYIPVEA